jgi:hypothetical protein
MPQLAFINHGAERRSSGSVSSHPSAGSGRMMGKIAVRIASPEELEEYCKV